MLKPTRNGVFSDSKFLRNCPKFSADNPGVSKDTADSMTSDQGQDLTIRSRGRAGLDSEKHKIVQVKRQKERDKKKAERHGSNIDKINEFISHQTELLQEKNKSRKISSLAKACEMCGNNTTLQTSIRNKMLKFAQEDSEDE